MVSLLLAIVLSVCAFAAGWEACYRKHRPESQSLWWRGFEAGRDYGVRGERVRHRGGEGQNFTTCSANPAPGFRENNRENRDEEKVLHEVR